MQELGSFVRGERKGALLYGVIREHVKPVNDKHAGVFVEIYDNGVPHRLFLDNCIGDWAPNTAEPITHRDYLEHLGERRENIIGRLYDRKMSDLAVACWSSRLSYLDGVMENIKFRKPAEMLFDKEPETGVYVVHGISHRLHADMIDPSCVALEGVRCEPRLSPQELAAYMGRNYPYRFGSIETFNAFAAETRKPITLGYHAYEIPKEATSFVKDPKVFELTDDYDRHLFHVQESEGSGTHQ